jgi:hypothetical protein
MNIVSRTFYNSYAMFWIYVAHYYKKL